MSLVVALAGCQCAQPIAGPSVLTLDFGAVPLGSVATQKLEIDNPGDQALELKSLQETGGAFSVRFHPVSLPADATASFVATFAPHFAGPAEQGLVMDTSKDPIPIVLRGLGVKVVTCPALVDLDLGSTMPGLPVSRVASLPGGRVVSGDVGAFSVTDSVVTFHPTAVGYFQAVVSVTGPPECASELRLTGESFFAPLGCTEDPVDFGTLNLGVARQRQVTVHNAHPFETAVVLSTAAPFHLVGDAALVVPAHGEARATVEFRPEVVGTSVEPLMGQGLACRLAGVGGGGDIDVTSPLALGRIPYFAAAPSPSFVERTFTVSNTGVGNLTLTRLLVSGQNADSLSGDIAVSASTSIIPPRSSAPVTVRVTPHAQNLDLQFLITVESDDFDEAQKPVVVTARSVGLPPCNYSVTPSALSFGHLTPPDARTLTLSVKNLGQNPNEICLLIALELAPGSNATFSLPNGPVYQRELMPLEQLDVTVRASATASTAALQQVSGSVRLGISSPTSSQRDVPLTAQLGAGCLVVAPKELHFGNVQVGCASATRSVTVYDTCAAAVPLGGITSSTGEVVATLAAGTVVAPSAGAPVVIPVVYRPLAIGSDVGRLLLQSTQGGVTVDDVIAFDGAGNSDGMNVDTFVVGSRKADVLVVIDNSGSMGDDVMRVRSNLGTLIHRLELAQLDFHVGVAIADCSPGGGLLLGMPAVLTSTTPNVDSLFASRVDVGTSGATECPTGAAIRALTLNPGFLRADATLSVVIVSDMDEPQMFVASDAMALEAARNRFFYFGPTGMAGPTCAYDGLATGGAQALASALSGIATDICSPDWSAALAQLVLRAGAIDGRFVLEDEALNGQVFVEVDGLIITQVDPRGALVWEYDPATRTVAFQPLFAPAPGSTVRVHYTAVCN